MERIVLVIDDDTAVLRALKRVLRKHWTVLITESPDQALAWLAQYPVSVVLSDYRMPEINGVELMTRISRDYPNTSRFLISGQADYNAVSQAISSGACHRILAKPWQENHLLEHLEEGWQQWQQRTAEQTTVTEPLPPVDEMLTNGELILLFQLETAPLRLHWCFAHQSSQTQPLTLDTLHLSTASQDALHSWAQALIQTVLQLALPAHTGQLQYQYNAAPASSTDWQPWATIRPALTRALAPSQPDMEFPIL